MAERATRIDAAMAIITSNANVLSFSFVTRRDANDKSRSRYIYIYVHIYILEPSFDLVPRFVDTVMPLCLHRPSRILREESSCSRWKINSGGRIEDFPSNGRGVRKRKAIDSKRRKRTGERFRSVSRRLGIIGKGQRLTLPRITRIKYRDFVVRSWI